MKLVLADKRRLALLYVAGTPLEELCAEFGLSEKQLRQLRENDEQYLELEEAALDEAWDEGCRLLRAQAEAAATTLRELVQLNPHNVIESVGPNGGPVLKRRVDPHLVREQRRAAETLLTLWLEAKKIKERQQARLARLAFG
jgi:hypothetical protein